MRVFENLSRSEKKQRKGTIKMDDKIKGEIASTLEVITSNLYRLEKEISNEHGIAIELADVYYALGKIEGLLGIKGEH